MNDHYPPILVDATPDDVLAVLRDQHRQQSRYDPGADPQIVLSRASTVADWRQACDLIRWKPLAKALNEGWEIDVSLEQWHAVLEPAQTQTLGGVCDLIARHAKVPCVRPARLLGRECRTAGVFLTIRSYLTAAGADVHDVAPSTALEDYTRRHPGVFLSQISRLAPGALPPVRISTPAYHTCLLVLALSLIAIPITLGLGWFVIAAVCAAVAIVSYLGVNLTAFHTLPTKVAFGNLRTFGDLSRVIAAHRRT